MSQEESTFDFKPLDNLIKAIASKKCTVKIGILGNKNARKSENGTNSNAVIGAAHEYGSTNLPIRSFLRMPIFEQLPKKLEKEGALNKKDIEKVIKEGNFKDFVEKIGIMGVATVLEAFDTAGFGKWSDLKEATWARKKVKQILVETHQLRDSIDYRIDESPQ